MLTVALALLTFAATIWDVSSANRPRTANADIGADRVYVVNASEPGAVRAAVDRIDPTGGPRWPWCGSSRATPATTSNWSGVQTGPDAAVSRWPDKTPDQVAALAASLDDTRRTDRAAANGSGRRCGRPSRELEQRRPMGLGIVVGEPGAAPALDLAGPRSRPEPPRTPVT